MVGKYLALLLVYLIPLCLICFYPLIFSHFGDVYLLTAYGSILSFVMGSALIAIGVFISSLTKIKDLAGIGIAIIYLITIALDYRSMFLLQLWGRLLQSLF